MEPDGPAGQSQGDRHVQAQIAPARRLRVRDGPRSAMAAPAPERRCRFCRLAPHCPGPHSFADREILLGERGRLGRLLARGARTARHASRYNAVNILTAYPLAVFGPIDWMIVAAYFAVMIYIGVVAARKDQDLSLIHISEPTR